MQGYQHERLERAPIHCAASQGKEYYDTLKELFTSPVIDPDILNSDGKIMINIFVYFFLVYTVIFLYDLCYL